MALIKKIFKFIMDVCITMFFWLYFTVGSLLFFHPFYIAAYFFSDNVESSFQRINNLFYKVLFILIEFIIPGLDINIPREIYDIKSSIIISNHTSYLDSILLISIFKKQKTIVKGVFFKVPFLGLGMKYAGYIPLITKNEFNNMMVEQVKNLKNYLSEGGNLFIFPEGTRSRDGKLGPFKKGAFNIAKRCNAPIEILYIKNTNKLYKPGKFFLNTCVKNSITIERLGRIEPHYNDKNFILKDLMKEIHQIYEKRIKQD